MCTCGPSVERVDYGAIVVDMRDDEFATRDEFVALQKVGRSLDVAFAFEDVAGFRQHGEEYGLASAWCAEDEKVATRGGVGGEFHVSCQGRATI